MGSGCKFWLLCMPSRSFPQFIFILIFIFLVLGSCCLLRSSCCHHRRTQSFCQLSHAEAFERTALDTHHIQRLPTHTKVSIKTKETSGQKRLT